MAVVCSFIDDPDPLVAKLQERAFAVVLGNVLKVAYILYNRHVKPH